MRTLLRLPNLSICAPEMKLHVIIPRRKTSRQRSTGRRAAHSQRRRSGSPRVSGIPGTSGSRSVPYCRQKSTPRSTASCAATVGIPTAKMKARSPVPSPMNACSFCAELARQRDGHDLFRRGRPHRTPPRLEIASRRSTPTRSRNAPWSRTPKHPLVEVPAKRLGTGGGGVVVADERQVVRVSAVTGARVGPVRGLDHAGDGIPGQDGPLGPRADRLVADELLDGDDGGLAGPPDERVRVVVGPVGVVQLDVPVPVGAVGVDDGHVGADRRHGRARATREGIGHRRDPRIRRRHIRSHEDAAGDEGHPGRPRPGTCRAPRSRSAPESRSRPTPPPDGSSGPARSRRCRRTRSRRSSRSPPRPGGRSRCRCSSRGRADPASPGGRSPRRPPSDDAGGCGRQGPPSRRS